MSPVLTQVPPPTKAAPIGDDVRQVERRHSARDERAQSRIRLPAVAVGELFRNLASGLEAGVPLMRALAVEVEQAELPAVGEVCEKLGHELKAGAGLAESLAQFPRTFPGLVVNLIRAGEQSGQLVAVMNDLADFLAWREQTRKTLKKAAMYPLIVLTAVYYLVVFIFGFVLQQFASLFDKLGAKTPDSSRQAMELSHFVAGNLVWFALAWPLLGALVVLIGKTDGGAKMFARVFSGMPVIRGVIRCFDLARLTRNLAVLVNAGIPLLRALQLSRDVVTSPHLRESLVGVEEDITGGKTFLQAAQDNEALPPRALNLVHVGEESGQMATALARLATYYKERAGEAVAKALAVMTPALTLFLAVLVGGIAAMVMRTLYASMLSVGKS